MTYPIAGMVIALGLVAAAPATAQQARKAAAANSTSPIPVPRADFIRTMDVEFGKMDADSNKVVTKAEIEQFQRAEGASKAQEAARVLFVRMDTDKNGQLSMAEFARMAATPARPNPGPVLDQSDLNKDAKITLVEYRTAKLINFDRMDSDKDGVVSIAEMKAAGLVK